MALGLRVLMWLCPDSLDNMTRGIEEPPKSWKPSSPTSTIYHKSPAIQAYRMAGRFLPNIWCLVDVRSNPEFNWASTGSWLMALYLDFQMVRTFLSRIVLSRIYERLTTSIALTLNMSHSLNSSGPYGVHGGNRGKWP
jgi:hypothetical protein